VPKGKLAGVKGPSLRGRVLARDMLPVDRGGGCRLSQGPIRLSSPGKPW